MDIEGSTIGRKEVMNEVIGGNKNDKPLYLGAFDARMLIAQAQCEGVKLVSIDGVFSAYDVGVVW